jgi:hypothetical protein
MSALGLAELFGCNTNYFNADKTVKPALQMVGTAADVRNKVRIDPRLPSRTSQVSMIGTFALALVKRESKPWP